MLIALDQSKDSKLQLRIYKVPLKTRESVDKLFEDCIKMFLETKNPSNTIFQ